MHVSDSFGLGNAMRGEDQRSEGIFSYVRLEQRVPADHPLRAIRDLVDAALRELSRDFGKLYARHGRPSIPPERLLRALLLQAFFTVRSERQLMEQLDYNLLFRWFVGLSMDDRVWDASVFCKNQDRLLDGDIAAKFFASVLNLPQLPGLLSSEHFSADGTLIEASASMKSFVPKDGRDPPSGKGSGSRGSRNGASDDREPQRDHHRCAVDRGHRHGGTHHRARHDRGQCQARRHRPGIAAAAWWSGSSCLPPPPTTSSASRKLSRRRHESAWSVKDEAKSPSIPCVRRSSRPIDCGDVAHIKKIALKNLFFSSLLELGRLPSLLSRTKVGRTDPCPGGSGKESKALLRRRLIRHHRAVASWPQIRYVPARLEPQSDLSYFGNRT